jgi:septum formation protein
MGLRFESVIPKVADEGKYLRSGRLSSSLLELAGAKAASVARTRPDALVLGADTVVVLGKKVFGKPKDASDARTMIVHLSGKSHTVLTAVALVCQECSFSAGAVARTKVVFRTVPRNELDEYLERGDWRDKAGAYAIQGNAMVFIDKIEGCYYNVVGLPVRTTIDCFTDYASRMGRSSKGQREWLKKTK